MQSKNMNKQIQISGCLNVSANEAWARVKTTQFILNMSEPMFRYRMIVPNAVPNEFSDGQYEMIAIALGVIPLDRQKVNSKLSVDESSGHFVIHNISKGFPYSWDHLITLTDNGNGTCNYTDGINIYAGPFTPLFKKITQMIFRQRQKNWDDQTWEIR